VSAASAAIARQTVELTAKHKETQATEKQRLDAVINERTGDLAGAAPLKAVTKKLAAVRQTLVQRQTKLAQQTEIASRFSGSSPIGLSKKRLVNEARRGRPCQAP
jgi:hypothetical protein